MNRFFRLTLTLIAWASSVCAAQVGVAPIRVDFVDGKLSQTVTISNDSGRTMVMQPTAVLWQQDATGKDQYTTTRDIIVAPPVIEIPPKQRQTIRLALRATEPKDRERQYRLVVREVPPTNPDGSTTALQFAINLSLPVIVFPRPNTQPSAVKLAGRYDAPRNVALISMTNESDSILQVKDVKLSFGGQAVAQLTNLFYVLPGVTRTVEIPFVTAQSGKLSATKQLVTEIQTQRELLTRDLVLN